MFARDILKNPPLYTARFTTTAHVYQPDATVENEARASIDRLKELLPADIDPATHPTLLYIVGNLFVGGTLNLNGDAVTIEDTLRMYRAFEGQQINVEHNRASVVGYIVRAGLSEFGTDRLLTDEEARNANKPVNVAIVVALWKVVDKELVQYIIESALPGASTKDDLSLSFEVGFDEYSIIVMPKGVIDLAQAKKTITPEESDYPTWSKRLRVNKGSGVTREGDVVGRVLCWPIIPMGGGIVAQPAGAVKGIVPVLIKETPETDEAEAGMYSYSSTQCTLSAEDAAPFQAYAAEIPDAYLYESADPEKEGRYGREKESHVTIRYGLKGNDVVPIQLALQGAQTIRATLGEVTAFEPTDKPYDVLKVDIVSEDLHRLNALIKANCEHDELHDGYHPHLTIGYLRRGLATEFVGDKRFVGKELTFSSVTFSPAEGNRTEIRLGQPSVPPPTAGSIAAQSSTDLVYSVSEPSDLGSSQASMSQPTRILKLSEGWKAKLGAMLGEASVDKDGNTSYAGTPHGVDVILSDGRTIKAMKVLDAGTLGSDIEYTYDGVVITSMTPGVPNPEYVPPGKNIVYPTADEAARARAAADEAQKKAGQHAGYTGASLKEVEAALSRINEILSKGSCFAKLLSSGVSSSTPSSTMDLNSLKQTVANVKSPEDLTQAVAHVASFVDIIAKASEEQAAARVAAEQAQKNAEASLAEVKAQLATLTKSHNDLIVAQQAAAAEAALQTRLTAIDEVFAFDDETRADILPEIKALADDAAFASWMPKAKRLYKGYLKASTQTAAAFPPKEEEKKKDEEKKGDECKAAAVAQVALASAASNVIEPPIHNSIDAVKGNQSLADQLAAVLRKNTSIGGVRLETLEEAAKAPKKTR